MQERRRPPTACSRPCAAMACCRSSRNAPGRKAGSTSCWPCGPRASTSTGRACRAAPARPLSRCRPILSRGTATGCRRPKRRRAESWNRRSPQRRATSGWRPSRTGSTGLSRQCWRRSLPGCPRGLSRRIFAAGIAPRAICWRGTAVKPYPRTTPGPAGTPAARRVAWHRRCALRKPRWRRCRTS